MEVFITYLHREHNFLTAQIVAIFFFLKPENNQREEIWSQPRRVEGCTLQDQLTGADDSVGGILPLESGLHEGWISEEGHTTP